jgi:hypothetical protein
MKYFLITLLFSIVAHAGEWKRISPETIAFTGEITKEDVVKFQNIYRPTDTRLILTSTGGLNEPALNIASTLVKNKKLETVVHGVCASSCANYLFLAGSTRKIEGGVVGYHGSLRAYLESEKFRDDLKKVQPKVAAERLPKLQQIAKEEDAFFAICNVPREIFNRTQLENDSGLYDIYVPGPNAFLKYGIHNVVGNQDLDLMRSMIENDKIKLLYDNSSGIGTAGVVPQSIR